jgi:hypothetical protein
MESVSWVIEGITADESTARVRGLRPGLIDTETRESAVKLAASQL